jgi:signal peptidase I
MRLPGKRIALYGVVFVLLLVVFAYLLLTYTRRVDGTSMYPTLEGGDLVVIQPASMSDMHIGDIVVYTPPCSGEGFSVIHRVVGGTPDQGFKTQGDNNPLPDQDSGIARTPIHQNCLVGKVVFVVPYVETLASLPYGANYLLAFLIFLVIIVSEFGRRQVSEGGRQDTNAENLASGSVASSGDLCGCCASGD